MNFSPLVEKTKNQFNKKQLKILESIKEYDSIHLSSMGHNDVEGYQVFTPEFIVRDMCSSVGDDLLDFSKNVLEPTSGDGAFTVYIFKKRLETIKDNFEIESLKALSTIYSIEMDKELIEKQRNNIFTLAKLFVEENGIQVDESYYEMLKCLITTNFIWAMFNSEPEECSLSRLYGVHDVAYEMPNAEKKKAKDEWLQMPVWKIEENNIEFMYEEVTIC
ncbi:MAG: hypothetical protein ACI318_05825 [Bacilli bacterium]